jgi:alkylhydroperoxidase family enzyme
MLRLVYEIVRDVKASDTAVTEAKAHFSPQEIVEIIMTAGFYMMAARLTETTRVDVDAPPGVSVPSWGKVI